MRDGCLVFVLFGNRSDVLKTSVLMCSSCPVMWHCSTSTNKLHYSLASDDGHSISEMKMAITCWGSCIKVCNSWKLLSIVPGTEYTLHKCLDSSLLDYTLLSLVPWKWDLVSGKALKVFEIYSGLKTRISSFFVMGSFLSQLLLETLQNTVET